MFTHMHYINVHYTIHTFYTRSLIILCYSSLYNTAIFFPSGFSIGCSCRVYCSYAQPVPALISVIVRVRFRVRRGSLPLSSEKLVATLPFAVPTDK